MKAYKFLAAGTTGRFSGVAWPKPSSTGPGAWLAADGPLEPCKKGIHACRLPRLVDWIDDELWEVELNGALLAVDEFTVAERGRLVRQVIAWNEATAADFVNAVRARADETQLTPDATPFAIDLAALSVGARPDTAVLPAATAALAPASYGAIAANVAFVTAHLVAISAEDYGVAFTSERVWQDDWLAGRLGLRL